MLSRSNSIAGDRLRRAKSTSSAHTSASGQQRLFTSIDPFVSHRDAEAAAVEAFSRARRTDEMAAQSSRPKPNRRRSQKTGGKSEGSHFEDARKKALAQTGESRYTLTTAHSKHSPVGKSSANSDEETVVTRKRSVIPPAPNVGKLTASQPSLAPPLRKRTSGYTDGSPAPRYSLLERRSSTLQVRPSVESGPLEGDNYTSSLAHLTAFGQSHDDDKLSLSYQTRTPMKGKSTDQDTQSIHADALQPRRVRERKSFLGSFQKRRATDNGYNFDTGLPPFNQASSNTAAPIPHQSAYNVVPSAKSQQKSRNFSDTIKGRLKKVFRRVSKPQPPPPGLPPQQVEAKDFHFAVGDYDLSEASMVDYTDPFMTVAAEDPKVPSTQNKYTTASTASKSRVTSWSNSTINQSSVRTANGPFTIGQGPPRALHKSDSNATLRKTSSLFFGRPIRNKLRRSSKADLKSSSEESQSLYSALQRRMRTSRSTEAANEVPVAGELSSTQPSSGSGAFARLPSQAQRVSSTTHLLNPWRGLTAMGNDHATIRPVSTPDLPPVPEATHDNSSATPSPDRTVLHHVQTSSPHGSSTPLRRSCAIKAPGPSKDQLARRKDVAEKRRSSTLAPFASGDISAVEDNPYILPSMATNVGMSVRENHTSLPHSCRADVISPSVYSRATDGASPRPETPMDIDVMLGSEVGATKITVTGREVRRYEISPEQRRGGGSGSQEWRDWIASELSEFAQGLREEEHDGEGPADGSRPTSTASGRYMKDRYPVFYNVPADKPRSRASSRQSNASSRHAQGRDVVPEDGMSRSMRRLSKSRTASVESGLRVTTASINAGAGKSAAAILARGTAARQRRISKPRSFAEIEAEARLHAIVDTAADEGARERAVGSITANESSSIPPGSVSAISATQTTVSSRPKSNYDLRANWKVTASAQAKALQVKRVEHSTSVDQLRRLPHPAPDSEIEVAPAEPASDSNVSNSRDAAHVAQRKPRSSVDVDTTLLRISAGPYAATKSPSAEKKSPPFRGHSHTFNQNQENARPPSAAKLVAESGEVKRGGTPQNPFELEANVVRQASTKVNGHEGHDLECNTRTSATGLPALSSSEWLAAGSSSGAPLSKHHARVGGYVGRKDVVGVGFGRSRGNQSQVGEKDAGESVGRDEGVRTSPGQRLVSCWLKEEGRVGGGGERERSFGSRLV
ncbi:hypothetical protein TI39_contig4178g00002 [Zymoseptoria brevis]|uniref:Uncharacterized protein n=1 Tax=Zymoseptoria brevis TaxID=1047168 RepID=A0A0F4GAY6_9PEZI|nr:hypothetical protein TI39_contig4178g00002 [Zymoseptoria brevis]